MVYKLYPLQFKRINWRLYYTVKTFMSALLLTSGQFALLEDVNENFGDVIYDRLINRLFNGERRLTVESGSFYLIFPKEDLSVSYEYKALCQEAIILHQYTKYIPSTIYDIDEEGDYVTHNAYFYYERSDKRLILHREDCGWEWSDPQLFNNERLFVEALRDVLCLMQNNHLQEEEWYKRLNDTSKMLDADDVNELHILHNAGLYDADDLWALLSQRGLGEEQISDVRDVYRKELHLYAMYVLNRLDWIYGGYNIGAAPKLELPSDKMLERFDEEVSRRDVYHIAEQDTGVELFTSEKQQDPEVPSLRRQKIQEDMNKQIAKTVAIFLVVAVIVLLCGWAIEYSKTGAITVIGGGLGIVGLAILRNVRRLMSGYQYKGPLWKRMTVVMSVLFGIIFCLATISKCAKQTEPLDDQVIYEDTIVVY